MNDNQAKQIYRFGYADTLNAIVVRTDAPNKERVTEALSFYKKLKGLYEEIDSIIEQNKSDPEFAPLLKTKDSLYIFGEILHQLYIEPSNLNLPLRIREIYSELRQHGETFREIAYKHGIFPLQQPRLI